MKKELNLLKVKNTEKGGFGNNRFINITAAVFAVALIVLLLYFLFMTKAQTNSMGDEIKKIKKENSSTQALISKQQAAKEKNIETIKSYEEQLKNDNSQDNNIQSALNRAQNSLKYGVYYKTFYETAIKVREYKVTKVGSAHKGKTVYFDKYMNKDDLDAIDKLKLKNPTGYVEFSKLNKDEVATMQAQKVKYSYFTYKEGDDTKRVIIIDYSTDMTKTPLDVVLLAHEQLQPGSATMTAEDRRKAGFCYKADKENATEPAIKDAPVITVDSDYLWLMTEKRYSKLYRKEIKTEEDIPFDKNKKIVIDGYEFATGRNSIEDDMYIEKNGIKVNVALVNDSIVYEIKLTMLERELNSKVPYQVVEGGKANPYSYKHLFRRYVANLDVLLKGALDDEDYKKCIISWDKKDGEGLGITSSETVEQNVIKKEACLKVFIPVEIFNKKNNLFEAMMEA